MSLSRSEEQLLKEILNHRSAEGLCDLQYWNRIVSDPGEHSKVLRGLFGELNKKQFIKVCWASDGIYLMSVLVNGLTYFEDNKEDEKMKQPILLITANENETNSLLNSPIFQYKETQGNDADDYNFYSVGTFGKYPVAHFEIASQGTVNALSQLAIAKAIEYFKPVGLIMVGIAFGKGSGDEEKKVSQKIGDVLISTQVVDYESGKVKEGEFLSDGSVSECGPRMVATLKHYAFEWNRKREESSFNIEFGQLLSGDKVIDDTDFKKELFKRYPRAIGGEMEGRGVHEVCRSKGLNEWIIVKSICDWADGKKGEDKESRQQLAAKNAVDFLSFVFDDPESFKKLFMTNTKDEKISLKGTGEVINFFGNSNTIQVQQHTNNSSQKMSR